MIILSLILLLLVQSLHGNGILPQILLFWAAYYSIIMFTIGFLLKYMCIGILINFRKSRALWEAFYCTLLMNFTSTLFGFVFRVPFAYIYLKFMSSLMHSDVVTFSGLFYSM